jgi:hypothetical protein
MPVGTTAEQRLLLRLAVGNLRARESRRVFDSTFHVGQLGGEHPSFVARAQDLPALDAALRVDVVSALVAEVDQHLSSLTGWLTRCGPPELHDQDLQWLAAARAAAGEHGREVTGFYAITRTGWLDVESGETRTWKRLRL